MRLHENATLFRQAVQATADKMDLAPIYVEKDYWVTYVLNTIFNDSISKGIIFKGGTSLLKCFNLIDRFSEDIDLVLLRHEGETDSKLKQRLKMISKVVEAILPEIDIPTVTTKTGMNRKTAHAYNKIFKGNYGQVRDVIVLEATWLGYHEPFTSSNVISFVGQMLADSGLQNSLVQYGLQPFKVLVLEPKRTICEKIMSLVRFSYSEDALSDLRKKIRHAYDLHHLLNVQDLFHFFVSEEFDAMLNKVAQDDVKSFRNNNAWLALHPKDAVIFNQLEQVWPQLKPTYLNDFKNLVFGKLPDEKQIFNTLKTIQIRLEATVWQIQLESR